MTLSIAQDQILSPKSTEMVKLMAGSHGHCPCDRGFCRAKKSPSGENTPFESRMQVREKPTVRNCRRGDTVAANSWGIARAQIWRSDAQQTVRGVGAST